MVFSYSKVEYNDHEVKVDVALACGARRYGVAFILDGYTDAPILMLSGPIGFLAIAQMMDKWLEVRDAGRMV